MENLDFLLNKYNIDKNKYLNCISNINYYNKDNIVEKNIDYFRFNMSNLLLYIKST